MIVYKVSNYLTSFSHNRIMRSKSLYILMIIIMIMMTVTIIAVMMRMI